MSDGKRSGSLGVALAVVAAIGLGSGSLARAQYFGGNKVQYKHFKYEVLKTEHFDIYFYPEERSAVEDASRMAERWYARLSTLFHHQMQERQPIILYASPPDFEQTNVIPGEIGEGTGGVTEVLKRRVVLPFAGSLAQTDHVLGHELVHAFQYDITAEFAQLSSGGFPTAVQLPLWFIEGMAEYLSLGPIDANTAMWMRDAARDSEKFPTIRKLSNPRFFPYRYGHALSAYVAGRWGDEALGSLLKKAGANGNVEKAIESVLGVSAESLSEDWRQALVAAYEPLASETLAPGEYGRPLVSGKTGGGKLNIGAALSPDGKRLVFLSEKDLWSIDMFLADVATGRIERRIVTTATNAHWDSLEFIDSAGTWDPTGRRFAFAALGEGKPELVLLDVDRDRIDRRIPLPLLGEIYNPTWSPDGRQIAFTALAGGFTDLFVLDLESGNIRRLTEDPYVELHPAWSPEGKSIAIVTDRFDADLAHLKMGSYCLARIDPASGQVEPLPSFAGAKNISPQYSSDGASLYFVSDQNGIANVYRLDLTSGESFQLTNLYTGVSGVTDLSPTLSVASRAGIMVFSVYEEGNHNIYMVDSARVLSGVPVMGQLARVSPALLPPQERVESRLVGLLEDPATGLPDASAFRVTDYRPHLSLDYIGQPFLVAGADPFGTFIGGGTSFFWSDMLGNHNVAALVQAGGGFQDIGGLVGYTNLARRWNWGSVFERIPYFAGSFATGVASFEGEPVYVEQVTSSRQINTVVTGLASYPFNKSRRVELSAGFRHIGFEEEVATTAVSLFTGELLVDETEALPSPASVNLGTFSAAFVHDTSVFGATSPVLGQRYRIQASPVAGSLSLTGVLADYRHYIMPRRPFTVAARILHSARYGADAEDNRLVPLFLGYPSLVRGYEIESFSASECHATEKSACPEFDQLLGSKILLGNVELRFPLLGVLRGGRMLYGPVPIEAAVFTDMGVAWYSGEKPSFFGGDRKAVKSAGVAFRVNVLGLLIAEVDWVRPFDRPAKGWIWQFSLTPGF